MCILAEVEIEVEDRNGQTQQEKLQISELDETETGPVMGLILKGGVNYRAGRIS